MGRDDEIQAVVDVGRRTRRPTPRWLWIAALLVGATCATGFAVAMLTDERNVVVGGGAGDLPRGIHGRPAARSGVGAGAALAVGAGAALVIGASIARQRRSHSSRKSP
jgi:hypothetical protein